MSTSNENTSLFDGFPPVSMEEWERVIKKDLNGADYKKKLRWDTGEGIEALPFYRKEDLETIKGLNHIPVSGGINNTWEVCQPIFKQDIQIANKAALDALKQGTEALLFRLHIKYTDGALGGDLEGTTIQDQQDFRNLLKGIELDKTPLHFDSGLASPALIAMLHNECERQNLDLPNVRAMFMYDPFAFSITQGRLPKPEKKITADLTHLLRFCNDKLPQIRCMGIDARIYHNAGATLVQELGYALATGTEYLARLTDTGCSVDEIAPHLYFSFSIGSNYFLEIAKFRAARKLWSAVINAYEPEKEETSVMYIHGTSSEWDKTLYEPYINILRTTTEGMAGAIAGCDSLTLNPFDLSYTQPDDFSTRIAKNTQLILKEETYLDKVVDPSSGSYYIEELTNKIVEAAWNCFQEVEQQGGLMKSMLDGYIQTTVEESRQKHDQEIASRGRIFVGINQFPNTQERIDHKTYIDTEYSTVSLKKSGDDQEFSIGTDTFIYAMTSALKEGAYLVDLVPALFNLDKENIRPIRPYRGPAAFEELRMATENHESTPMLLTVPVGNKKMRKARSTFAVNLFGCVGYTIEDPTGFESIPEAVNAIREKQPQLVVLCSSDEEYKTLVPELCEAIRKIDKNIVIVLAGYPEEKVETYKKAGVDEFIYARCNIFEILKKFQHKLGIIL